MGLKTNPWGWCFSHCDREDKGDISNLLFNLASLVLHVYWGICSISSSKVYGSSSRVEKFTCSFSMDELTTLSPLALGAHFAPVVGVLVPETCFFPFTHYILLAW